MVREGEEGRGAGDWRAPPVPTTALGVLEPESPKFRVSDITIVSGFRRRVLPSTEVEGKHVEWQINRRGIEIIFPEIHAARAQRVKLRGSLKNRIAAKITVNRILQR